MHNAITQGRKDANTLFMGFKGSKFGLKSFNLGESFLQRSGQQGHQFGLIDALVDGVAVLIHFILRSGSALGDYLLGFVSEESINRLVGIRDEVKTVNLKLIDAINCAGQGDDVFF